jgi:pimeloyl-ACP methyl ester carboxylesterase
VTIEDYDLVADDLHAVVIRVKQQHPGLALVLVGHSMGGMIGVRYAQLHRDELAGLVLSGPVLGSWSAVTDLLELDEIPDDPLDVSTLSRDPRVGTVYTEDELDQPRRGPRDHRGLHRARRRLSRTRARRAVACVKYHSGAGQDRSP